MPSPTIASDVKFVLAIPGGSATYELPAAPNLGEALHVPLDISGGPGEWTLTVESAAAGNQPPPRLDPDAVEDIGLIVRYAVE